MRIAHLLLVHKNPEQVALLIKNLQHAACDFYIHVDKKSTKKDFYFLADNNNNVFFIKKRASIFWAGYGTIQATLNGFSEILKKQYNYINVISGQDFPIKQIKQFVETLERDKNYEYITCEPLKTVWTEALPRVEKFHLVNWKIPGKFRIEKLLNKIISGKREFPLDYIIAGRANWFTITSEACQYILTFLDNNPKVIRFFKYCWGADEFIFSTILYNSSFKDKIRNNFVYVDWNGKKDGHPRILLTEDYEKLIKSEKYFARKFDLNEDKTILAMLENWITKKM